MSRWLRSQSLQNWNTNKKNNVVDFVDFVDFVDYTKKRHPASLSKMSLTFWTFELLNSWTFVLYKCDTQLVVVSIVQIAVRIALMITLQFFLASSLMVLPPFYSWVPYGQKSYKSFQIFQIFQILKVVQVVQVAVKLYLFDLVRFVRFLALTRATPNCELWTVSC